MRQESTEKDKEDQELPVSVEVQREHQNQNPKQQALPLGEGQDLGNSHQEPPIQQERQPIPPDDTVEKPQEAESTSQGRFQGSKLEQLLVEYRLEAAEHDIIEQEKPKLDQQAPTGGHKERRYQTRPYMPTNLKPSLPFKTHT